MSKTDMFLRIDGAKQGPIRGESDDPKHLGEIDVLSWSWGMVSPGDPFASPTARTSFDVLNVSKPVDCATTPLMSALRSNEVLKKAVLTVRKAGGAEALEYFTITIERGRLVSHRVTGGGGADSAQLCEDFSMSFQKVRVEYAPQGRTGSGRGTTTFETEINLNG